MEVLNEIFIIKKEVSFGFGKKMLGFGCSRDGVAWVRGNRSRFVAGNEATALSTPHDGTTERVPEAARRTNYEGVKCGTGRPL